MRHLIWLIPAGLLIGVGLFLLSQPSPAPKPEQRRGLLAREDLETGRYALVYSYGAEMPEASQVSGQAWLVDDHDLIVRHRDEIDTGFSFLDFVPGERGARRYIYVFRDGVKVGGALVTRSDQIVLPEAIRQAARLATMQSYSGNRAQTLAEQSRLVAAGAQVDIDNGPKQAAPLSEFYFGADLPTLAVAETSDFDLAAYIGTVDQRLRTIAPEGKYALTISSAWERPPGTVYFIDPDRDARWRLADDSVAALDNVWLYDLRISVVADASLYQAFVDIDPDALVADQRNLDLIATQFVAATGAPRPPANVVLESYTSTGRWTGLTETQYGLTYWQ